MVKMTFTFDEQTVGDLRRAASRLKKPNSVIVREAIQDYASRADRLGDDERKHLLSVLDRIAEQPAHRSAAAVKAEIRNIGAARRSGGRRARVR